MVELRRQDQKVGEHTLTSGFPSVTIGRPRKNRPRRYISIDDNNVSEEQAMMEMVYNAEGGTVSTFSVGYRFSLTNIIQEFSIMDLRS